MKIKYSNILSKVFFFLKNNFLNFNVNFNNKYPMYKMLYNQSTLTNEFFVFDFFVKLISDHLLSMFFLKISQINSKRRKHLKKKFKKKYEFEYKFISENKRLKILLKQLILLNGIFKFFKFIHRLYFSLLHTLLEWKESYLYKTKVKIYISLTSTFKKTKGILV